MEIKLTASELMDAYLWDRYCELSGTSVWAVNEGCMSSDESLVIPEAMVPEVLRYLGRKNG